MSKVSFSVVLETFAEKFGSRKDEFCSLPCPELDCNKGVSVVHKVNIRFRSGGRPQGL